MADPERNLRQNLEQMERTIRTMEAAWEKDPEKMADFLNFGSRFYRHSLRNNMLIYSEDPNAHYCQSYEAWNNDHYRIKKNGKGMKVYVPVDTVILKVDGDLVPLEHATKEERIRYQAGEIESITQKKPGVKVVFDIAQTTYPVARYHELFHPVFPETVYPQIRKGLNRYAQDNGIKVDSSAGSLRELIGSVSSGMDVPEKTGKKFLQSAIQIMVGGYIGLDPSQEQREKLKEGFQAWKEAMPDMTIVGMLNLAYKHARGYMPEITRMIEKEAPETAMQHQRVQEEKPDIYDRIKQEVSIVDYARESGYTVKRVGRYYTLQEHDSVRLDPARNCYWQNSVAGRKGIGEGGSVIDFAQKFVYNGDLHLALKELTARVGGYVPERNTIRKREPQVRKPKELELPERGKDMHRVYAYLTQTRCIDQDIVQDFVKRRMLYQDTRGNCVFVSRDQEGKPVFANFRGTLSNIKFLGDVPGSDYSKGFYISNGADKLILTESVIDAMSVMSILHGQGVDYKQYDYLPLSGATKQDAVIRHLQEKPMQEVLLALDHDLAGVKNMQGIHDRLLDSRSGLNLSESQVTYHVPAEKDWNADLVSKAGRFLPLSDLKFLDAGELPAIHYCAVQSTADFEERGFHKRNGKDQYRLVELAGSEIQAMDIRKNVIFRSPEEVRELIPNMYEEVPYTNLLKMRASQIGVKETGQKMIMQKEDRTPEKETSVSDRIRGFTVSDSLITAVLSQNGQEETLWREEGRTYYATGEMYDNTYQEHDLTEAEADAFENYLTENGIELDERSPMLMRKENTKSTAINGRENGTSFLDKLQEQQMKQEKDIIPMPEISIGIGS